MFLTAAHRNLFLRCKTAFLYGHLPPEQRVYIRIPDGMAAPIGSVAVVDNKSAYSIHPPCVGDVQARVGGRRRKPEVAQGRVNV